jgi:hypothetical protein
MIQLSLPLFLSSSFKVRKVIRIPLRRKKVSTLGKAFKTAWK